MVDIYPEWLVPFIEYVSTIKKEEAIYEWGLALFLGGLVFFLYNGTVNPANYYVGFIENVLAILIGFSIAAIAVITAGSSKNIEELKERKLREEKGFLFKLDDDGKKISLYQLLIIELTFAIGIEVFALLYNLIGQFFITGSYLQWYFSIDVFFVTWAILLTFRAMTNLFLVVVN